MPFEIYKPMIGGKSTEELVSFSPAGRIGISKLCYENRFNSAVYVELYYDPETRQVGIKPLQNETEFSLKLTSSTQKKRQATSINGKGFYLANNIEFKKLERYKPTWDETLRMLIVQLD